MARRDPRPTVLAKPRSERGANPGPEPVDTDAEFAAWLGERTRRVALGLAAALMTARAYWPGEPDIKAGAGTGLSWDFAVLIVAGLAVASSLIGGTLRLRWSWTDAAVIALFFLVGLSSTQAYDRRTAINLAWDWAAVGLLYVLVRNLPRTREESWALVGALVATGVAVAVYGLYQTGVELPQTQAFYLAHKAQTLGELGIAPGSTAQVLYENRLLRSNEPTSTFALANSLAGFLVGPLVVMLAVGWEGLFGREGWGTRMTRLALGFLPALAVLVCVVLTKSRSAYIGLAIAVAILAWRDRRRVGGRTLALAALGGAAVLGVVIVAGLASGRLDREVLTESTKSLGYRWQYWVGAWPVVTENSAAFWKGHGPGNFTAPYLLHKLPQSSEELFDPHNLVLEVWATAGFGAMIVLLTALGLAFSNLLSGGASVKEPAPDEHPRTPKAARGPTDPPRSARWLVAFAAAGWVLAVVIGGLDPFAQFDRWLILGAAWLWAVLFGVPLWRGLPIPAAALGAAALAIAVNLLAAGGIGIAGVALMLWTLIALGLNLREDRGGSRLRDVGGRLPAFGLAVVWVALLGSFWGAIVWHVWPAEAAIAQADAALRARPPRFEEAADAYDRAINLDKYSSRPWLGLAYLKFEEWRARGSKADDLRWKTVALAMAKAVEWPRNTKSWALNRERAMVARDLIRELGTQMKPQELLSYRGTVVQATRSASLLYPTNAPLHAELAEASAELGMFADAVKEGHEALRLHALTPHADKKLPRALRKRLLAELPGWEKASAGAPHLDAKAR